MESVHDVINSPDNSLMRLCRLCMKASEEERDEEREGGRVKKKPSDPVAMFSCVCAADFHLNGSKHTRTF